MNPEVSVVLPVHNGGAYLEAAVASILGQTCQDLELVLVDDHSTDGAIGALAVADPRLRVLQSLQRGVSHAFNTGLENSRGRFVARMDADDIARPERLQRQLSLFEDHPEIGIAGCCVDFFSAGEVGQGNAVYRDWLNAQRTPEQIRLAMFIESPIPNPTAMFRREVIDRLGGYRDPDWPEDYDLFLRADALGIRMAKPEGLLHQWRDHPARLTLTDDRYSLENFQRAKIHYLVQGRLPDRELLIWGAGPTGKVTYDLLLREGVDASGFIDVHPRRIGGYKRGKPVFGLEAALRRSAFLLVAVGARNARRQIREHLDRNDRTEGEDYLFVA